jgi:peptidyl-prolyl cis-trans isomerase D
LASIGPFARRRVAVITFLMITYMRRLASTWVAKALFVLLVLSFAVWGIEDVVRKIGRDTAVAKVGGMSIEAEEAQLAARREMSRIARQMGNRFEPNEAIRRAVAVGALENLIGERAMVAEAQRMGVVAPEEMVRESLTIAADTCIYTNHNFSIDFLSQGESHLTDQK